MLPDAKICWFCIHAQREKRPDKRGSIRYFDRCKLGIKKVGAHHSENFRRCKGFEPNPAAIRNREVDLHRVIRECRVELGYLERLSVYAQHKRRRGAEYDKRVCVFKPLFPECENISEGKTVRADGFEEKEKRPDEGAGGE